MNLACARALKTRDKDKQDMYEPKYFGQGNMTQPTWFLLCATADSIVRTITRQHNDALSQSILCLSVWLSVRGSAQLLRQQSRGLLRMFVTVDNMLMAPVGSERMHDPPVIRLKQRY